MSLITHAENTVSNTTANTNIKLPLEVLQISDNENLKSAVLLADKTSRLLYFIETNNQLPLPEIFEIDIGKNEGPKTKRDDKKTPEGIYLLQKKLTQPEIPFDLYGSLAFTTNYPNVFDKFENKTGSGIWLHSVPDTVPLNRGSRGCVVLRNDIIKGLANKITLNRSYLIINNKTTWVNAEDHKAKLNQITLWLNNWLTLWNTQNLDTYIEMYSNDFSAPGYNKKSWLKHKERLKSLYKTIHVEISTPHVFHMNNQYLIKFVQKYKSDLHEDTGIKTLYVLENNDELQILREEWEELKAN